MNVNSMRIPRISKNKLSTPIINEGSQIPLAITDATIQNQFAFVALIYSYHIIKLVSLYGLSTKDGGGAGGC